MPSRQFLSLPQEKQDQIIDAALEEFATYGFDLASTNRIARRAGISKGALFKYFDDKEALFLHLSAATIRSYLGGMPKAAGEDIFTWIQAVTAYKFRYLQSQPRMYALWMRMTQDQTHPVYAKALTSQTELLREIGSDLTVKSTRRLRPGVTPEHVRNLLVWIANGLQETYLGALPDEVDDRFATAFESVVQAFEQYADIVRNGLYEEA